MVNLVKKMHMFNIHILSIYLLNLTNILYLVNRNTIIILSIKFYIFKLNELNTTLIFDLSCIEIEFSL